jgi:hypothetical protein
MKPSLDNFVLSLCTKTWIRDSHGLFDYESTQTRNLNAVLAESINITRKKNEIKTLNELKDIKPDEELLFHVKHANIDEYFLENQVPVLIQPTEKNINDLSNKIWYVLKNDPQNSNNQNNQTVVNINDDYYLCKNDVIKLGRVKYSLNEIYIPSKQDNIEKEIPGFEPSKYDIDELNKNTEPVFDFIFQAKEASEYNDLPEDEKMCKICYSDENDKDNPLVHLCNCNGGLRFSHYLCIKKWMETKLSIKENEKKTVKSYNIKSFNCEICKTPYPFKFKLKDIDKPFELIELQKPTESDYVILESLNQMKENCNIKSIHVIKLTGDDLAIGRGHESDVRINDISVSRSHAKLKYNAQDGTLLLRDLKSKFGTLILIKRPLKIKEKKIQLQIGRTYIEGKLMSIEDFEKLKKERKQKIPKQSSEQSHNPEQNLDVINNNDMDIEENNDPQSTHYPYQSRTKK